MLLDQMQAYYIIMSFVPTYSFDALGFTATYTTLWNRLPRRTKPIVSG